MTKKSPDTPNAIPHPPGTKAEQLLKMKSSQKVSKLTEAEMLEHIHALEVHLLELEMVNQELSSSNIQRKEAAQKYTELYDFAPSGYYTLTHEGKIVELNLFGAKILGKERGHLINSQFAFYISSNSKIVFRNFIKNLLVSHTQRTCEIEIDSNKNLILQFHLSGIFNQEKKLCFITAVDITELRSVEEALLKSKNEFLMLAEAMPQIVWIADVDGNITYLNKQWFDTIGDTYHESYGRGWYKFFQPDDMLSAMTEWQNVIRTGKAYSSESRLLRHDGVYQWFLIRGVPVLNSSGSILKWFGTCTDINEIKCKEEELIIAKDLAQENDRLKSAFLANMSHEIRTPMNGILGFSSLLKTPGLSGQKQLEYISIIEKSGTRMLNIINDIVDISKIESGLMEVSLSETNINEQIDFVYKFFKESARQKGLQLFFKNELTNKESIIYTDREKVYAILINLVKNAIKFTDAGSIEFGYEVVANNQQIHPNPYGKDPEELSHSSLRFYVKDTGIGIATDRQLAIFERFVQADISDIDARQGAGLGLTISKAFVELLGGKIWLESNCEVVGSTFYFSLPFYQVQNKNSINEGSTPKHNKNDLSNKLKILIVENDEMSELFLRKILGNSSLEILTAYTGAEAITIIKDNPDIDLIMMDIKLRNINGYEATALIRLLNKNVIIIAQTAYALTGDKEKAIEAGCNDYISKPIDKDELLVLLLKYFPNKMSLN